MSAQDITHGQAELRAARREDRSLFWAAGLFSVFINLLMLTGPLFMLQIYDRVLSSQSEETLLSLTLLMAAMFLAMGLLEHVRTGVLSRVGARLADRLERRVFSAGLTRAASLSQDRKVAGGLGELDTLQRFLASKVFGAVFDLPWTPVFLAGITLFHPWLGIFALAGGAVLVVVTAVNQWLTRAPLAEAHAVNSRADRQAERLRAEAEMVQSVGMEANAFARWRAIRGRARSASLAANDLSSGFSSGTRAFRMFLQSAILALGAYLVLRGEITPGMMIAASILLGRALAPVDLAVGQWPMIQRARQSWGDLARLLDEVPAPPVRTALPNPKAELLVQNLTVALPGAERPVLRGVSFEVTPGQAMGVIGPSGSGKSTLAKAITGVRPVTSGKIRLDGAALDQYGAAALSDHIGYLPQRVQLFDGTIADNIARLSPDPDPAGVVAAAKAAAAHELITRLADGYDTRVETGDGQLSGGQLQRIGLARAFYGKPVLLVLDEPNANLDHEGSEALNTAVRAHKAAGGAVLIMAHRPAAIQECESLMVLDGGEIRAIGPRDEVLRKVVQNHAQVVQSMPARGGST